MADDIVPALNTAINEAFERNLMTDRRVARLGGLIRDGTKDFETAHRYSQVTGEAMSKALRDVLTAENLPNETLYYNIADRTVTPALKAVHSLNTKAAADVQKSIDAADEIGLTPIIPDFPVERTAGLIDKIAASETLEKARAWLGEAIINNAESYVDDFVRDNASARYDAGLKVTLSRITSFGCCSWCAGLAGTYEYGDHPDDIFRRHEYCRCMVVYKNGRQNQSAWSKRIWTTPEEIATRKAIKPDYVPSDVMLDEYENRMERDRDIERITRATGFNRRTASQLLQRRTVTQILEQYGRR